MEIPSADKEKRIVMSACILKHFAVHDADGTLRPFCDIQAVRKGKERGWYGDFRYKLYETDGGRQHSCCTFPEKASDADRHK